MLQGVDVNSRTEFACDRFLTCAFNDLSYSEFTAAGILAMEKGGSHPDLIRNFDRIRYCRTTSISPHSGPLHTTCITL